MWKLIVLFSGAASAFVVGRQLDSQPPEVVHTHDEGNDGLFSLDVTPRDGDVDILIVNERAKRAVVAMAVEVVDDRGAAVTPARRVPRFAVGERAAAPELEHALPHELGDGYYQVRVTAALSDGEQAQTKTVTEFLQVRDGQRSWLSASDFYQHSNAVIAEVRR